MTQAHREASTSTSSESQVEEERPPGAPATLTAIPTQQALEIRRLAHDLSNALEVIIQTSYLVGTLDLDANGRQWVSMLDAGVKKAVGLNAELRDYVRSNS